MRVDLSDFDSKYAAATDPWGFTSSAYELGKYDTTIAALAGRRYRRGFEPACSIGVLTQRLAELADGVVACDSSPLAIERATARLADSPHVELFTGSIPEWWPDGSFDLIVLSELGYYWDEDGWVDIVERCTRSLDPGGDVVAVHWLGSSPDHILHGTTVHRLLRDQLGEPELHLECTDLADTGAAGFVLDRWSFCG
jgi:SAM-dependent methyltransferase